MPAAFNDLMDKIEHYIPDGTPNKTEVVNNIFTKLRTKKIFVDEASEVFNKILLDKITNKLSELFDNKRESVDEKELQKFYNYLDSEECKIPFSTKMGKPEKLKEMMDFIESSEEYKEYTKNVNKPIQENEYINTSVQNNDNAENKYGNTPLHLAIIDDNTQLVKLLLEKGASVHGKNKYGNTPLHLATLNEDIEITELLLRHGAKMDERNDNGEMPLHFAAWSGHKEAIKKLATDDVINAKNKDGQTVLMFAAQNGRIEVVKALIAAGAKVDMQRKDDGTALMIAAQNGHIEVVKALIAAGAKVNRKDNKYGTIALIQAAQNGRIEAVKALIAAGVDVNGKDNKYGTTALIQAAQNGHIEVVEALIAAGANVDAQRKDGWTALMIAAQNGHVNVGTELINNGADVNAKDNNGNTALHIAAVKGYIESVLTLIYNGANIYAVDHQNKTPLDLAPEGSRAHLLLESIKNISNAAKNNSVSLMITTLEKLKPEERFIAVNVYDQEGKAPLHYAVAEDYAELVLTLINNGANVNVEDYQDKTPLDLAPESSRAHLLLESIKNISNAAKNNNVSLMTTTLEKLESRESIIAVNVYDQEGKTPLYYAVAEDYAELVLTLISNGANVNVVDYQDKTPLDLAQDMLKKSNTQEKQARYQKMISILSDKDISVGAAAACLSKGKNRNKRDLRVRVKRKAVRCLLIEDEEGKIDKEKTGIEVDEKNLAKSEVDREKLRSYQEDIKVRMADAVERDDENDKSLIEEEQSQLNKLILEIQQAQAIRDFHVLSEEVSSEKFNNELQDVIERTNGKTISSESLQYFKQIIKINLLRTVLPLIKNERFKELVLSNPEKFGQDQGLLNNVFEGIKEGISNEYEGKEKLSYEDFESIESKIYEQVSNVVGVIESLADQDINKSHLSDYVFKSVGLRELLIDTDVSSDLRNKMSYEALVTLGLLIADHANHIKANHHGHENNPHMDALESRIKNNRLLSMAHDLYYLHKNEGNIDQKKLYSNIIKDKVNLYSNIDGKYALNDLHNQFNVEEIKGFSAELRAYDKEVITIHSGQVQTSHAAIQIGIRDSNNNDKNIVINGIEDIKDPSNLSINEEEIQLELQGKKYTIISQQEGENVKFYLAIDGYKAKIGDLVSSFTNDEKSNIHNTLNTLNDRVSLLQDKKAIEEMAELDVNENIENSINDIKQEFLKSGVEESTWVQLNEQLENISEEVYAKYVDEVGKSLTEKNIGFDSSKFELAKIKGGKGGRFMSFLAIYDLFDSAADLKGLGDSPLNTIFGINGLLDAMDDVRESLSTQYMRSDGKIKTRLSRNGLGKITSKIPADIRKSFVRMINNPIVQGITFATIAWQFGHSIDQIIKGENVELNAYFATSSGIKLTSMSMKPISMGVMAATRGLSVGTKALRVLSVVSKILGKLSIVIAGVDLVVSVIIEMVEADKYVRYVGSRLALMEHEKIELFLSKTPTLEALLFHVIPSINALCQFGVKELCRKNDYTDEIKVKSYLNIIKENIIKLLDVDYNIAAVVQSVTRIKEKYDEIIKFEGNTFCSGPMLCHSHEICKFERDYTDSSFYGVEYSNLFSLNISRTLNLRYHLLSMSEEKKEECKGYLRSYWHCVEPGCQDVFVKMSQYLDCINSRQIYIIDISKKHLPDITLSEYENGLRVVNMPLGSLSKSGEECGGVINHKKISTKCNVDKVYRKCENTFTIPGEPFIFTKLTNNQEGKIVYLPGPKRLTAAANYPAVMYISKANSADEVCYDNYNYWQGSKNHESTFIVSDKSTLAKITGGEAKAEENVLAMNADLNDITVDLRMGTIYYDTPKCSFHHVVYPNITLKNVYNYVSNTTAQQDITTNCKTRIVSAGGGSRGNTVRQGSANCQDEDHEVRVVHKNDVHYRGSKQAIFVVNRDSNNATITIDNNFNTNKNSTNIIRLEGLGIEGLRIKEAEGYYNLTLLTDDGQATSVKVIDDLKNLVIYTEKNQVISVQDKSLPDFLRDMLYQKLNHSGEYVDDRILKNSKTKLKAIILQEVDAIEGTPWTARNIADKSNNLGIPSQIVATKHREKELIEQAVIHDTYSKDIHVDLSTSGDFNFGYPLSYVESIKTKDENTTIFSFLDGYKVHVNRNGHSIGGYVFADTRSVSEVIAAGDYQEIVGELNTTVPIKIGDELVIIGTKGDDVLHNNPNYKTHLVGNGGKDRYVIDMNLNDFSIPEVTIYDPNGPIVDMYDLKKKFGIDFTLEWWFDRNYDIIFDLSINDKGFSRIYIERCKLRNVNNLVPFSEDMSNVSVTCDFNQELLYITRENTLSRLDSDNFDPLKDLKNLFNNGRADLSVQDDNGNTPLHFACKNCNYDVVKYLIEERNARINAKNKDGKTPLDLANECPQSRKRDLIVGLFERAQSKLDEQLLSTARGDGNLAKIRSLVNRGADLNAKGHEGDTPLHLASLYKKFEVVVYLIKNGANINARNNGGNLPVHRASQGGNLGIVKHLTVVDGVHLNTKGYGGDTPLHIAAWKKHLSILKYLVARGADIDVKNNDDKTILDLVAEYMSNEVVEELRKIHKSYLDQQLLVAAKKDDLDRVINLHRKGADVNARDNYDMTPLHFATDNCNPSMTGYLMANGADVNVQNKGGKTPLDLAQEGGYSDIERILKEIQEARPIRHRRHKYHHRDRVHHHRSNKQRRRRALNEEDVANEKGNLEEPKISAVNSSGEKPKSWLNEGVAWVKGMISGFFAEDRNNLSNTREFGYNVKNRDNQHFNAQISAEKSPNDTILEMGDEYLSNVNGTGMMQLLDVAVRKITGAKPTSFKNNDISKLDAQGYALEITKVFKEIIKLSANKSGISAGQLKYDQAKILGEIKGKIISGRLKEIPEVLSVHAVKALPQGLYNKQLGKFKVEFDKEMNAKLDKLMEAPNNGNVSIIHKQRPINANKHTVSSIPKYITNEDNYRKVSKPATELNNASIVQNLTQVMGVY